MVLQPLSAKTPSYCPKYLTLITVFLLPAPHPHILPTCYSSLSSAEIHHIVTVLKTDKKPSISSSFSPMDMMYKRYVCNRGYSITWWQFQYQSPSNTFSLYNLFIVTNMSTLFSNLHNQNSFKPAMSTCIKHMTLKISGIPSLWLPWCQQTGQGGRGGGEKTDEVKKRRAGLMFSLLLLESSLLKLIFRQLSKGGR